MTNSLIEVIVWEILKDRVGKENAITAKDMGINSRYVRYAVHKLRCMGYPVCSGRRGYWVGTKKEIDETLNHLYKRAEQILNAASGLEKSIK